jgi:CheY-like chemotaxis protein
VTALLKREQPDLIVLDFQPHRYDGFSLLREIKESYRNIPVVLCAYYPILEQDMKSIPADHFVVKSSNLKELKSEIRKALGEDPKGDLKDEDMGHRPEVHAMVQTSLPWHD